MAMKEENNLWTGYMDLLPASQTTWRRTFFFFFSISGQNVVNVPTSIVHSTHVHQPLALQKFLF